MSIKSTLIGFDYEEIDSLIYKGADIEEIKSTLENIMANDAEITENTDAEIVAEVRLPVSVPLYKMLFLL
ncbi:MAG: hypothetical protein CM15mV33_720 [uncultured marine virus]|nr:MAG: hypothetical protein CM15mV33_720 [uncultured marine virus]